MFNSVQVDIPCPQCSQTIRKSIGWIKINRTLTCNCGAALAIDPSDVLIKIRDAEREIEIFQQNSIRLQR